MMVKRAQKRSRDDGFSAKLIREIRNYLIHESTSAWKSGLTPKQVRQFVGRR